MKTHTIILVLVALGAAPKAEGQIGGNIITFFSNLMNPGTQIGGFPNITSLFNGSFTNYITGGSFNSSLFNGLVNISSVFGGFPNLINIFNISQIGGPPNVNTIINGLSGGMLPCTSKNATACQMCMGVLKPSATINNTIKSTFNLCTPTSLNSTGNNTINLFRTALTSIFGCQNNSMGIGEIVSGMFTGLQGLFNNTASGFRNFTCCMTTSMQKDIISNAIAMVPPSISSKAKAFTAFKTKVNLCALKTPVTPQTNCSITNLLNCVFQACISSA